jgi:hypothetical protein|tara:strand:- start:3334 stop:3519 length:186 start_codon:yes stop_codon:yes gene_type:complete
MEVININYGDCIASYNHYLTDEKFYYYSAVIDALGVFPYIKISKSKTITKNMCGYEIYDVY